MKKDTKKFIFALGVGFLTFILFAFNFINMALSLGGSWWTRKGFSGYSLIGSVDNFGGFLSDAFSVLILIGAGLIILISVFGILNSLGKTKISVGKASLDIILKWTLFIMLCLTFLNMFWVLIDVGSLNGLLENTKYAKNIICFTPFLIFIVYGALYCVYCLLEGKFMWMPNFWEKFGKKTQKIKASKVVEEKIDENQDNVAVENDDKKENE